MRSARTISSRSRLVALFAAALVAAPGAAGPAGAQAPAPLVSAGFDAYVAKSLHEWNVPGLSVAIVKGDRSYVKGYGVRTLGRPETVDANTVFEIASTSKAFTATAIGMLVDQKKLDWDDPVVKALPWFQLSSPWVTREITLRDMLTHRSGLTGGYELFGSNSALSRDEILRRMRYLPFSPPFRSGFGYSNLGYLVAGQTIPAVSGQSWDAFLRARIFEPLGMTSTSTTYAELTASPDHSGAHEAPEGKLQVIRTVNGDNIGPAGSVNSSAADMAHWVEMLLGGGVYHGKRIIESATLAETMRPEMVVPGGFPHSLYFPDATYTEYGMGWFVSDYRGHRVISHSGDVEGFAAQVGLIPDLHAGVVVLSNADGEVPVALEYRAFDEILGSPSRDWSGEMLANYNKILTAAYAGLHAALAKRVLGTHPTLPLARYAGTYHNDYYGDVVVRSGSTGLSLQLLGLTRRLEHWDYDTFRVALESPGLFDQPYVTFALDDTGTPHTVKIGDGDNAVLTRVP
ncbi:MAG TPA: serine hydrolase [Candidatus Elarobacter sp.]|nr:serine hydrolase [Candidatus Elarobacter sp.]